MLNVIRRPAIQAIVASHDGKYDEAIRLLEPARRIELGVGPGTTPGFVPYIRALVYLHKKDGASAALEFRKIVEHRYLFASASTFS